LRHALTDAHTFVAVHMHTRVNACVRPAIYRDAVKGKVGQGFPYAITVYRCAICRVNVTEAVGSCKKELRAQLVHTGRRISVPQVEAEGRMMIEAASVLPEVKRIRKSMARWRAMGQVHFFRLISYLR